MWLVLKGGDRVRIQTEIVKFTALPFPFSNNLVVISRRTVVVQGQQRNLQKRVMNEQPLVVASCVLGVAVAVALVVS